MPFDGGLVLDLPKQFPLLGGEFDGAIARKVQTDKPIRVRPLPHWYLRKTVSTLPSRCSPGLGRSSPTNSAGASDHLRGPGSIFLSRFIRVLPGAFVLLALFNAPAVNLGFPPRTLSKRSHGRPPCRCRIGTIMRGEHMRRWSLRLTRPLLHWSSPPLDAVALL